MPTAARRRAAPFVPSSGARFALCAALCAPLLSACVEEPKPATALNYTENAKLAYERAMRALEDKNWETVESLFNEVRKNYGYSRYARLAELRIADANYQQGKLPEAISGYRSFVHDYPNDPEVPYARYQIAKGEYDSVSVSVFLPPLEERDLASVNDALTTIRAFLADYPNSEHAPQLRYMLDVVLGLLARHELYVARYYLARDRFDAAAARVGRAVKAFPQSGLEPEALLLLAEIRLREHKQKEARGLLEHLIKQHPESPFSVPARKYLAWLGQREPVSTVRQGTERPVTR